MTWPAIVPGVRASLRYAGPAGATELVADVLTRDDEALTLLPEGRGPVRVELAAIRAARVVPPRPVRPVSPIEDTELLAARGWPGSEQERLGGWLLRAGSGGSQRANSALAVGDPGMPMAQAVDRVVDFYVARGLTPRIQLPEEVAGGAGLRRGDPLTAARAELTARGWAWDRTTLFLVADLRRLPDPAAGRDLPRGTARWYDAPVPVWRDLDATGDRRTAEASAAPARYLVLEAADVTAADVTAAEVWADDTAEGAGDDPGADSGHDASGAPGRAPVAVARLAIVDDWCGLSNLVVRADVRGAGWAHVAMRAVLDEARTRRTRFAYLQVYADNEVARALYAGHGFVVHHGHRYASASDDAPRS